MNTRESEPLLAEQAKWLYVVRLDISHEKEAEFNDLYENEHIPALVDVPGTLRASRYVTDAPGEIRYMALYDLKNPDVINTDAWRSASDSGKWITRIRPHITRRSRAMYELIFPKK